MIRLRNNNVVYLLSIILWALPGVANGQTGQAGHQGVQNNPLPLQNPELHHVESHLVVDPRNPDHWLVAAMIIDDPEAWEIHSAVWRTTDAGKTWTSTDFPDIFADPYLSIDVNGKVYFSGLGQSQKGDRYEYYYISNDGGSNWSQGYPVLGGHDHPFLKSFGDMTVWWSTTRGNRQLNIKIANNGSEFTDIRTIRFNNNFRHDNMMHAVLSDGTWILPFAEYTSDRNGIDSKGSYLFRTSNFSDLKGPIKITDRKGSGKGLASIIADTSASLYKGNLYYLYPIGEMGQSEGIGLSISKDKGETWRDTKVTSGIAANEIYYVPTGTVNRHGVLGVYWYQKRTQSQRSKNDLYFSYSKDGGNTFSDPIKINNSSSNLGIPINQRITRTFPGGGHYSGISTLPNGNFLLIWSDSRNGVYQLYTTQIIVDSD